MRIALDTLGGDNAPLSTIEGAFDYLDEQGDSASELILLGDKKVLNTKLRFEDEFARHKILDILGDFYLLGKPIRGKIKASKSGHTQNVGLLKIIRDSLREKN